MSKLDTKIVILALCSVLLSSNATSAITEELTQKAAVADLVDNAGEVSADDLKTYRFYVDETNLNSYNNFLKGRDPIDVSNFTESYFERHLWEMYVFQVAPVLGGCHCRIEYVPYYQKSMHARSIMNVVSGRSMSNPIASNADDPRIKNENIELSEKILNGKDYYAGLYTYENRNDLLQLSNLEDIKKLRFVVSSLWAIDVELLSKLGVKVVFADSWISVIKMIIAGRADVLIQPFSSEKDMQRYDMATNARFLPIKGVKVLFGQSRSYVVNVKHPDGRRFLLSLNKGIRQLRENGLLRKGAKAAGFYRDDINNWKVLK